MKHTIFNRFSLGFGAILVAAVAGLTATPAMAAEAQSDQATVLRSAAVAAVPVV